MASSESLPILLIIAGDKAATDAIVAEVVKGAQTEESSEGLVWVVVNKYYVARVLLYPVTDDGDPPSQEIMDRVEAFIIYTQNSKGACPETAARRFEWCALQNHAEVRIVAADEEDSALEEWAWANNVEPIWWTEDAERGREALHAHTWRGLRELPEADPPADFDDDEEDEYDADTFATLLSAVCAARQSAPSLPRDTRHRRAEHLVSAILRADYQNL